MPANLMRSLLRAPRQLPGEVDLLIEGHERAEPNFASTFQAFNDISAHLERSYREMEQRVGELHQELDRVSEERLRELNAKEALADHLENLLELLPVGVVVLDSQGVVSNCNPAARGLLGEPLEGETWFSIIERCFAPRCDDGHEISLKDGRRVNISTQSLDNGEGQLLVLTDMTETRALQQRLNRHKRLSEMGKMVSSLAHQIRTPLSAAMLYAGHINRGELSQQQIARFSTKLMGRLNHLEQQIRDMLVFARGDVKLTDTVNVQALFEQLREASEVAIDNHDAVCEWSNHAPGVQLLCNCESVIGALLNLINNGLEAASQRPELKVECRLAEDGKWVAFFISDNGGGVAPELVDRLGEPFLTTKSQGTGLGLAVVHAVANAHQGNFRLMNRPGAGVTAILSLPVWRAEVNH